MKKSTKALLLSALVCPGAGYFVVKKPLWAMSLIIMVIAALAYMFSYLMSLVQPLLLQIQAGDLSPDPMAIHQALQQLLASSEPTLFNACSAFILVAWLFSSLDGYRRAKTLP